MAAHMPFGGQEVGDLVGLDGVVEGGDVVVELLADMSSTVAISSAR